MSDRAIKGSLRVVFIGRDMGEDTLIAILKNNEVPNDLEWGFRWRTAIGLAQGLLAAAEKLAPSQAEFDLECMARGKPKPS